MDRLKLAEPPFHEKLKAICSDVDGTLLNADREISSRLQEIAHQLPETVPFILASSRMPAALRPLQDKLGKSNHPLLAYNGALILTPTEILRSVVIPGEILQQVFAIVEAKEIHVSLFYGETWHACQDDAWARREINNTKVIPEFQALPEMLPWWLDSMPGAHKIMIMGEPEPIHHIRQSLQHTLPRELTLFPTKPTYLEIAPASVSKAEALQLGLDSLYSLAIDNCLTFGDGHNDLELIAQGGLGIAVANAIEEVKQVARYETASGKEDGVAQVLEKFLLFLQQKSKSGT